MGFKINYREDNADTLEAYLLGMVEDAERTEKEMLQEAAEQVKDNVVSELNKHRRAIDERYKGRPAMADDVKIRKPKGTVKIQGGKMTGTLWHLVNDGNLHSIATHFMDNALKRLDQDIDKAWDKVMK